MLNTFKYFISNVSLIVTERAVLSSSDYLKWVYLKIYCNYILETTTSEYEIKDEIKKTTKIQGTVTKFTNKHENILLIKHSGTLISKLTLHPQKVNGNHYIRILFLQNQPTSKMKTMIK